MTRLPLSPVLASASLLLATVAAFVLAIIRDVSREYADGVDCGALVEELEAPAPLREDEWINELEARLTR